MYITISALTMEEAEFMLKILDKWLRHFYNTYGAKRLTSFNRRANDNIRAQILVTVDREMLDYVKSGATWEMMHRLDKGISYHINRGPNLSVVEICTCESAL